MLPILFPLQDQQKKRGFPLWLKNTLLIGTGFASGLLAHSLEAPLFSLCTTLPSSFISLIEQSQMANAMQSLEGIFQILGILFATYTFCRRHVNAHKTEASARDQAHIIDDHQSKNRRRHLE